VAGSANGVTDALSRPPPSAVPCMAGQGGKTNSSIPTTSGGLRSTVEALPVSGDTPSTIAAAASSPVPASAAGEVIDLAAIAAAQAACTSTQQVACTSSLHVKTFEVEGVSLLCDTSTGAARPLVPAPHRRLLFDGINNLAHPGVWAMKRLIKSRFVWPGMGTNIADWCSECQACNRGKVTRHVRAPLQTIAANITGGVFSSPDGHRQVLQVDRGHSHGLHFSAGLCRRHHRRLDCAVWHTDLITSDRGPQFSSAVWTVLCQKLGIRHILMTAYHPQSNGMVECFHCQLKEALRSRECGINWAAHLPWVLMGLRATPKDDSGISSVELVYGQELHLPGQPTLSTAPVAKGVATPPAVRQPSLPVSPATSTRRAGSRRSWRVRLMYTCSTGLSRHRSCRRTAVPMWCGGVARSPSTSSSAADWRLFLWTASSCTGAAWSRCRRRRQFAAARSGYRSDPLPVTSPWLRIFRGAPVESGFY
jgi:hypothetical protein